MSTAAASWAYRTVFLAEERHRWIAKNLAQQLEADSLEGLLNQLGGQGWELAALTPALGPRDGYPVGEFWAVFKRPQGV